MNFPVILIWTGVALTLLGLVGLGICISKALTIRREGAKDGQVERMQGLLALNMASVGIAFIGLAMLIVGLIF